MITIYGIRNCDTMKKAMRWLDDQGVTYRFHDYRKDGLDSKHEQCSCDYSNAFLLHEIPLLTC